MCGLPLAGLTNPRLVCLLLPREQVSHPLDFSTIKKRQKRGHYAKQGFSKLWDDIATVYRNAQLFNQVGCLSLLFVLEDSGLETHGTLALCYALVSPLRTVAPRQSKQQPTNSPASILLLLFPLRASSGIVRNTRDYVPPTPPGIMDALCSCFPARRLALICSLAALSFVRSTVCLVHQDESDCFIVAQKGLDSMKDRIGRALREASQAPPTNGAGGTIQKKVQGGAGAAQGGGGGGGGPSRASGEGFRGGESGTGEPESDDESMEERDNDSDEDFEAPPSVKRGPGRPPAAATAAAAPPKAHPARDYDEGSESEGADDAAAAAGDPRARRASPRGGFSDGGGGGGEDFYDDGEDSDGMRSSHLKRQRR